jgi:MFS family permease
MRRGWGVIEMSSTVPARGGQTKPEFAADDAASGDATAAGLPRRSVDLDAIILILVAALAMTATLPGRTFGLGLITKWLLPDLQITQVEWAHVNLWATLVGSLFCFPAGRLLDRYGARNVLGGTLVALGVVTAALARVHDLTLLTVLVTLTRGFGQSALSVVSIYLIGKSFDRRIAWPMAAYSVTMSIGFVIAFQTVGAFLQTENAAGGALAPDWRGVWWGVGMVLLIAAPLSWLALWGRTPTAGRDDLSPLDDAASPSFTFGESLRTPAFWVFALATSMFGLVTSGLALFNFFVLEDRGFTFNDFMDLQKISMPAGLIGQGCCGWLARRFSYQRITAVAIVCYSLGLIELTWMATPAELYGCGVLMGVSGGMITVVFFAIWSRLFGHRALGRIQGAAQMGTVIASAVGPLVFAMSHDRLGSYTPALYGLAGMNMLFAVACWVTPTPQRSAAVEST